MPRRNKPQIFLINDGRRHPIGYSESYAEAAAIVTARNALLKPTDPHFQVTACVEAMLPAESPGLDKALLEV